MFSQLSAKWQINGTSGTMYQTKSSFCYGTPTWPPRHHPLNLQGLVAYPPYMNTGVPLDKLSKVLGWRDLAINSHPSRGKEGEL